MSLAAFAQNHRLSLYGALSTVLVSAVIANAFQTHSNFYSATVYLSRSNASLMVLANYGVLLTLLFGRVVQRIFFGRLTNQEIERLYDRCWFFLTESLLAFTIFRDEFDAPFVFMFGVLLFLKCFHWLVSDRIDWMDQQPYPGPPLLFHARMNIMFFILWAIDFMMLDFAVESVLTHGVGGIILFGSEYAILLASCFNSMAKYLIMVYDIRRARNLGGEDAPIWENKSMYIFYVELVTDFLKLTTYLIFFMIVMTFFGLPLNIIRDVYMTGVSFYTRFRDLLRYRAATKDMENKYPDATAAELEAMSDRTCIICREEMQVSQSQPRLHAEERTVNPNEPTPTRDLSGVPRQQLVVIHDPPKKLPCGHVFHFQCLRSWLERQQSCPTCRRSVLEPADTPVVNGADAGFGINIPGFGGAAQPPAPQPGARPAAPIPRADDGRAGPPLQTNANAAPGATGPISGTPSPTTSIPPSTAGGNHPGRSSLSAQPRTFQGFAVGGQWQAWDITGVDAVLDAASNDKKPTHGEASESATGASTPTPAKVTSSDESQAQPSSGEAADAQTSTPQAAASGQHDLTSSVSPREAAAQAALRRLTGVAGALSNSSEKVPTLSTADALELSAAAAEVAAAAGAKASDDTKTASSDQSVSTVPEPLLPPSTPGAGPSNSKPAAALPALIPLFDPSSVAHRPFFNLSDFGVGLNNFSDVLQTPTPGAMSPPILSRTNSVVMNAYNNALGNTGFPWANAIVGPSPAATPATQSRVASVANIPALNSSPNRGGIQTRAPPTTSPLSSSSLTNASANAVPPSIPGLEIPPILTDSSQLSQLDELTREAIDERLRAIQEVQDTLFKAAEALQRARNIVPSRARVSQNSAAKGKGKARATFDVVDEDDEPGSTPTATERTSGDGFGSSSEDVSDSGSKHNREA